jgi:hypothetical protein
MFAGVEEVLIRGNVVKDSRSIVLDATWDQSSQWMLLNTLRVLFLVPIESWPLFVELRR